MTLIGNTNSLAFDLVPVAPYWDTRYGPERAAWAGMALWGDGENLCEHVVTGSSEVRDRFYIPMGPLVDWLVRSFPAIEFEERAARFPTTRQLHEAAARWRAAKPPADMDEDEWLDARDDWWERHFLAAGSNGALVPNVAFARDDEQLVVSWRPPRFAGDAPPRMAVPKGDVAVPWSFGRSVLEELAAQVATWLREGQAGDVYAWALLQNPLSEPQAGLTESLALFTGRTPEMLQRLLGVDGEDALLASVGLDGARDPAASSQCQVLRDLSPSAEPAVGAVLRGVGRAARRHDAEALRRWRQMRTIAVDAATAGMTPMEAGQFAAVEVRRVLGLDGQPIPDIAATLDECGLHHSHQPVPGHQDRMMVALHEGGSPMAVTLETIRTSRSWGQRFEAARALGHVLLDPLRAGAIGAASGPFAQDTRRRRSGAFAAELLLPESALSKASGGQLDGAAEDHAFEDVLDSYGVGARTAAHQLWNRGWLSSEELRDDLIDRFANWG
ncbi:MAG TPA: ImmA/IrrE family metallo-endopeptidase [Candidatus Dormibacteraeota bacterium]|nr:ImmA/IrrE family metallo-endopeptidase [Candidatus Dormibacteraeota bacterium]